MKYRLKPGRGGQLAVNVNGAYYRLKENEFREYPQPVIDLFKDSLEPESAPKTSKKETSTEENE